MKHILSLGAINKSTNEYVYPKIANKKDKYICPECNKDLILCQGKIKVHHFRHKVDNVNPCHHYSNPTESQIHKDAKILLKNLLERKIPISFIRNYDCCKKNEEFDIPEISETSNIQLEYRFEYNGVKIADVVYIDNEDILCMFEICNTHKTSSENRPEPWFEIDAETLIKMANDNSLILLKIPCIRCEKCDECIEKERKQKYKIRNDVEHKSSYNESDSYCCLSKPIMEILIDIICGDDSYKQWSNIYRYREESTSNSDIEENIKIGYCEQNNCCYTYYNNDLIRDIQNMQLYKYLKELVVNHGIPRVIFCYVRHIDTYNIKVKLERLIKGLFGCDEIYVDFKKDAKTLEIEKNIKLKREREYMEKKLVLKKLEEEQENKLKKIEQETEIERIKQNQIKEREIENMRQILEQSKRCDICNINYCKCVKPQFVKNEYNKTICDSCKKYKCMCIRITNYFKK